MRSIAAVSLTLLSCAFAYAQFGKLPPLPPDELALRTRLESDKSVIQLTCGLLMPIARGEKYAAEGTKQQADNTRLRLTFYKAALKHKTIRAGYTCGTDEGGLIKKYLLSEKRKLIVVDDYSRDPFGGLRIMSEECADLKLGHYVTNPEKEIVFENFELKDAPGKVVFLSCRSPNRLYIF